MLIKTRPTIWEELSGTLPVQAVKEWKGINTLDRFSIEPSYLTHSKNTTSRKYPTLSVRPEVSNVGSAFAAKVLGLGVWKDDELHAIANANWYAWNGSWGSSLKSGLSASAHWQFCNFKGGFSDHTLIGTNGVDKPMKYSGSTVTDLANAPATGKYVDTHDNRLYMAVDNEVHFSALSLGEDWSDTDPYVGAGIIVKDDNKGEDIVGLKAGTGHLLTFFPNSCYELYGTGPDDYRMLPVADDIGLLTNQCVANVNGVLYWLNENAIYSYSGGGRPKDDFSVVVRDYVKNMSSAKTKACAGSDGRRLYVAIPSSSATEPDLILEYDPTFSGIWSVWEDLSPLNFANYQNELYIGQNDGRVVKLGSSSAGVAWEAVTVPFGARIGAQNVRWHKLWLIAEVPTGSSLNVYLSASDEGEDWTLVKTVSAASGVKKQKVIIPVSTVANANYVRVKFSGTGSCVIYELDYQQRELPLTGGG